MIKFLSYERIKNIKNGPQINGIYWQPGYKAYAIVGKIADKFESIGGTWSQLGFPTTNFDENIQTQYFQGGYIKIEGGVAKVTYSNF